MYSFILFFVLFTIFFSEKKRKKTLMSALLKKEEGTGVSSFRRCSGLFVEGNSLLFAKGPVGGEEGSHREIKVGEEH